MRASKDRKGTEQNVVQVINHVPRHSMEAAVRMTECAVQIIVMLQALLLHLPQYVVKLVMLHVGLLKEAAAVLRVMHVKSMAVVHLQVFLTPRPAMSVRTSVQHQLGTGAARADLLAESVPATPPLLRRSS